MPEQKKCIACAVTDASVFINSRAFCGFCYGKASKNLKIADERLLCILAQIRDSHGDVILVKKYVTEAFAIVVLTSELKKVEEGATDTTEIKA